MNSSIYKPSEDSYLMTNTLKEKLPELLKENPNIKLLEIGSGSGIHLQTALSLGVKKENIFSSDINSFSVDHCKLLGFNCIQSDLFENFNSEKDKFDLIIFNPPYLPEDKNEPEDSKLETTGGKKGNEIIIKFLEQAKNYLNSSGKIFLIASSLAEKVDFKSLGYSEKEIGCEKLFFETLCLCEISILEQ
jgi:release factor glutamine methyltransferase